MCGIFGYFCRNKVNMQEVLELLRILEMHKHIDLGEKRPVGGHGAGVSFLDDSGKMVIYKVGKTNSSPVKDLSRVKDLSEVSSRVVLGHVRYASLHLIGTIAYSAAAQPYRAECLGFSEVISAHNGKVDNYQQIRKGLSKEHSFESESVQLNDSEVIPHLFEEKLMIYSDESIARKRTFEAIEGNNTAVLITQLEGKSMLHTLHKGKTRGVHVWKNDKAELILCSREEPLLQVFGEFLRKNDFEKVLSIGWQVDSEVQQTYELTS